MSERQEIALTKTLEKYAPDERAQIEHGFREGWDAQKIAPNYLGTRPLDGYEPTPLAAADVDRALSALSRLESCQVAGDTEAAHATADSTLVALVRHFVPYGEQIADTYDGITKWYA